MPASDDQLAGLTHANVSAVFVQQQQLDSLDRIAERQASRGDMCISTQT